MRQEKGRDVAKKDLELILYYTLPALSITALACGAYKGFCDAVGRANAPEIDFLVKYGPTILMEVSSAYFFNIISGRGINLEVEGKDCVDREVNMVINKGKKLLVRHKAGKAGATVTGGLGGAVYGGALTFLGYGAGYAIGKIIERLG